jgi:hypothetical protein
VLPACRNARAPPCIAQSKIKWRLQTYAGPALAEHVIKPAIDSFNKIAGDEMEIELFTPTSWCPRASCSAPCRRAPSTRCSRMTTRWQSPTEVTVFGGYFPFASRYSLDVPVLFNQYGLKEIWEAEYAKVGVKHISAGAWDPCHFATKDPINSPGRPEGQARLHLPDRRPLPGAVRRRAGDAALGRHRGRRADRRARRHRLVGHHRGLHGGLGRRDQLLPDQQHLRRLGGSFFANMDRWNEVPDHLKELLKVCMDSSHYYRQWWYWGGEANLRVNGTR